MSKLKKVNELAYNLRMFAESMDGSFGDLEKVLDKLVKVVSEMNGISVNTTGSGSSSAAKTQESIKREVLMVVQGIEEVKETLLSGIEVSVQEDFLSR